MKKQPKLSDLKISKKETNSVRLKMANTKSVKITINIDSNSLSKIKKLSNETGVPYQRMLNNLLKERLSKTSTVETKIRKLEKELSKIKQAVAEVKAA